MTVNLQLISTLLIGAASVFGAAWLRRITRHERPDFLPWLMPWGALCTIPALLYLCLCVPDRDAALRMLETAGFEPGWEMFAGAAGVLPGLVWDALAERREKHPGEMNALHVWLIRAGMFVVMAAVITIPYGFVFRDLPIAPSSTPAETQEEVQPSAPSATPAETQENIQPSAA